MFTLEIARTTTRMNFLSQMVDTLLRKQLLQTKLISNLVMMKSKRFNMQKYITKVNNLNPAKVNLINAKKYNVTQAMSIKEILDELEISKDNYYRALPILIDEGLELHLNKSLIPALLIIILMLV